MNKFIERYQRRRLMSSYFSVTLSIALVLFLLGSLGLLVSNMEKITNRFKEQFTITVFFKDTAKATDMRFFTKSLLVEEYIKSVNFISKEDAARDYAKELGEDFVSFLGYNPLQNSVDIGLKADYVNRESVEKIASRLRKNAFVSEVSYDALLISLINENIRKISIGILAVTAAFAVIAVLLINSSIRLSIYSKRFIIRTMQMVGANKRFIRRPFIQRNLRLGFIACSLASSVIFAGMYYIDNTFPEIGIYEDIPTLVKVFAGIYGIGMFIVWVSTYFATQRFLNLRTEDDLYY